MPWCPSRMLPRIRMFVTGNSEIDVKQNFANGGKSKWFSFAAAAPREQTVLKDYMLMWGSALVFILMNIIIIINQRIKETFIKAESV